MAMTTMCASPTCWRTTANRYCLDCEIALFAAINLQILLGLPTHLIRRLWARG